MEPIASITSRTYRFPIFTRLLLLFGTIFFLAIAYWAASDGASFVSYFCLTPFALLSLIGFIYCSYTLRIDENGVSIVSFFRKRTILWHEVADIQFKESGFVLLDQGSSNKVTVSSQVEGFIEAVRFISNKLSSLWNNKILSEFHTSWSTLVVFLGIGLLGILMIYAGIHGIIEKNDQPLTNIGVILIGLLCFGICILMPIRNSFEDDYLVVTYLGWKKRIHRSEIEDFFIEQKVIEYAYHYPVHLKLKNGKALMFNSLREGTFIFATSFKSWYEKYQPDSKEKFL